MDERTKRIAVNNIRKVTREHKDNCNSEDCGVNTYFIGLAVRELLGRELTEEEFKDFV